MWQIGACSRVSAPSIGRPIQESKVPRYDTLSEFFEDREVIEVRGMVACTPPLCR